MVQYSDIIDIAGAVEATQICPAGTQEPGRKDGLEL
jgi:hypothetical protein